jgi:hypothetical protein
VNSQMDEYLQYMKTLRSQMNGTSLSLLKSGK